MLSIRLRVLALSFCCSFSLFSSDHAFGQNHYVKASNTDSYDLFGSSVAISGDTMVVGAKGEGSQAVGVNGPQGDNGADASGAVYVFVHDGVGWIQEAYLKASNTGAADSFGHSVAVSGDTIVVGAVHEDSSATGVGGVQTDNSADDSGAAYVFVRNGTNWSQQAYLKASNTDAGDLFGWSLAMEGDTIVVGAYEERSNESGVNGAQSDNSMNEAGAAYVFVRNGTSWSQQAYLKASNPGAGDQFGYSMALSGETLAIGARFEASNATGVNGDQSDDSADRAGGAYVFTRSGIDWSQTAYLKPSNTDQGDWFGASVALTTDLLVVGATYEDSGDPTVNGDQNDNGCPSAGAAYVFAWNGVSWNQEAYLKASNAQPRDHFGQSVAVVGDTVVVGVSDEDSNASGLNGDQSDDSLLSAGAAYLYLRNGTSWTQSAYLKSPASGEFDYFGYSVVAEGDALLVGTWGEDSSATGLGGHHGDNRAPFSGAAYTFDLGVFADAGTPFCFGDGSGAPCPCDNTGASGGGCANSATSGAVLLGAGSSSVTNDSLVLHVTNSLPNTPGLLLRGAVALGGGAGNPVGNGRLCVNPQKRWNTQFADSAGAVSYGPGLLSTDLAAVPGATLLYQWWYRDVADPCDGGFNFSNGLSVSWH